MSILSCTIPFDLSPEGFDKVLVIEGSLTNEAKNHIVKISYTYPLIGDAERSFVNDAVVIIEDQDETLTTLLSIGDGEYITAWDFQGQVGSEYKLIVRLPGGKQYESHFQELLYSPPIDSIYDSYEELPDTETDQNQWGIQFFLDTHDDTGNAKFFRYEWIETYKIEVPFPSTYYVENEEILPRSESVGICYSSDSSNNILISTAVNNSQNRISEFPLRFIFQSEQQLRSRYSILAKQYALSETSYHFYRALKENNESVGSLSDKQTGPIVGNMMNIDDPGEVVLGHFEVSGVSEKRVFFSNDDFDNRFAPAQFNYRCIYSDAIVFDIPTTIDYFTSPELFIQRIGFDFNPFYQIGFIIETSNPAAADSVYLYPNTCTSCDWYARSTPPSFWEE